MYTVSGAVEVLPSASSVRFIAAPRDTESKVCITSPPILVSSKTEASYTEAERGTGAALCPGRTNWFHLEKEGKR